MSMQVVIGLKRLINAKQRLMPDLSAAERRELMLAMLSTVARAAHDSGLGPVALATSEPTGHALGRHLGVAVLSDGDLPWNEGLVYALSTIRPHPATVMYLAGDLPLLTAADLSAFATRAPSPGVAVARARDGGSNALLVTPCVALQPRFGERGSAAVHEAAARAAGLACVVADIPGLALDVDTVTDARDAGLVASLSASPASPAG